MDTTLVTVTLLSMGMAAALSVIVWRMLRDERLRGEARVLALTERAAQTPARGSGPTRDSGPATRDSGPPTRDRRPATRDSGPATRDSGPGTRAQGSETTDLMLHVTPPPAAAMFAEREAASPWGRRFAVMAGLALVLASSVLMVLTARDRTGAQARPATATGTAAVSGDGAATGSATGLELRSLRDSREAAALRITGLVQNPRGGAPHSRVTVTAYAFDDKGSFLASGRALIDVTALAPGDESPFIVSVPVTDAVARYRIGFRGEDGHVIAHIDKRQTDTRGGELVRP